MSGMFQHTPYSTGVFKPKPRPPLAGAMPAPGAQAHTPWQQPQQAPRAYTPWQQGRPQGNPMGGGTAPMQAPPGMGRVPQMQGNGPMQGQGPVQVQPTHQPRPPRTPYGAGRGVNGNSYKAALMEMGRNRAVAGRIR